MARITDEERALIAAWDESQPDPPPKAMPRRANRPRRPLPDRVTEPNEPRTSFPAPKSRKALGRMPVQAALEWAFGRECARLDLDVLDPENNRGGAVSNEWVIWQRHMLGATVDGGGGNWGGSAPHHDAEVIAALVANLPVSFGGRGMAVRVAECARLGITPDWMPDAAPQCVPVAWSGQNQYGPAAASEVVPTDVRSRWSSLHVGKRGRPVRQDPTWCPVTWQPTAQQIARARRGYLDWIGALFEIHSQIRACSMLSVVGVTDEFPPMCPWRK